MTYIPLRYEAPAKAKTKTTTKVKVGKFKIILVVLVMLLLMFTYRDIFIFALFCLLTAAITYYSKLYHFPIDVSPLFFLEIVITRFYGIRMTLLFILLGYVIPKVAAGSGMKWESYAFITVSLTANVVSMFLGNMHLLWVGVIASVIQYIGGIFISMISKPFFLAAADGVANTLNNLLWFLIFSDLMMWLLG